jgi:thiol-disulfide isomerase/thioredoxin
MPSNPFKAVAAAAMLVAGLLLASGQALARQPYDAKAFEQAQAAGKPILIHIHATWCPTCKKQEPILGQLEKERPSLLVYVVDFDRDKPLLRKLGVTSQSTLIVYKGPKEVGRSTGDTTASSIAALVNKVF